VLICACGGLADEIDAGTAPAPQPAAPPSAEQAAALSLAELRAAIHRLDGDDAPGHAFAQAQLLRVLALREGDGTLLVRARHAFDVAGRAEGEAGCRARLELARMEARDAWDVTRARAVATPIVHDFAQEPAVAACVAEARRLLTTLEALSTSAPHAQVADAVLEGVDVLGSEGSGGVRVVIRLSAAAEAERARSQGDGSERLDLSFATLTVPADQVTERHVAAGGLRDLSVAADGPGARVSLTLEPGAEVGVFALGEPARLVLDVAPRAAPTAAAGHGPPRLIVIDPGHGGDDWGARYEGMEEADLVLDIAMRVERSLAVLLPDTRVLLTRRYDHFISLPARTAMANALAADLFVSIHLNSADDDVTHGGVTTFVLDTGNERQALRLAARENGTRTSEVGDLSRLIAHLYRREQVAASRALAEQVQAATLHGARGSLPQLPDRGVQQAMFHVLVGARMPAVLVEASFLTEPLEGAQLRRPAYRQALADGIARGIARYAQQGGAAPLRRASTTAFARAARPSHTSAP